VHLYDFFSARRYIALTASVKFCIGIVQKRLGMNKFVSTKIIQEANFSKQLWGFYAPEGL